MLGLRLVSSTFASAKAKEITVVKRSYRLFEPKKIKAECTERAHYTIGI